MAQRNIDFGSFPDDPDADAIRTAFQKTQENFNELFALNALATGVQSVNRTPSPGVVVSPTSGNVSISANISCVQIGTNTLSLGVGGPGVNSFINISNSSQVIFIDIPSNLSNIGNISLSGNIIANNITANSNVSSNNIVVTNDITTANLNVVNITSNGNISGNIANITTANIINLTTTGNVNLGNVANIRILGGNSGQFLTTDGAGNLSWANASGGNGTVTSISTGTGLEGGPITSTGTISLANTAVTAGNYTSPNLLIDAQGRITAASNGAPLTKTISFGGANILNSEVLVTYRSTENLTFTANFTGWVAGLSSNPSANFVLDVLNGNTLIGTVTITTGGTYVGNTTGGTSKTINTNTTLVFRAPADAETVAANSTFSISAVGTI